MGRSNLMMLLVIPKEGDNEEFWNLHAPPCNDPEKENQKLTA